MSREYPLAATLSRVNLYGTYSHAERKSRRSVRLEFRADLQVGSCRRPTRKTIRLFVRDFVPNDTHGECLFNFNFVFFVFEYYGQVKTFATAHLSKIETTRHRGSSYNTSYCFLKGSI